MVRAARARALAASQRIGPAGALPDPQLQLGLMNRMAAQFGAVDDPMTMNQLQLMQMVPWPGKLGAARSAARHRAAAAQAEAQDQERMELAAALMAYYEIAYADRALDVMRRTRDLLRDFQNAATTMYAVGEGQQSDVLRGGVEVARMAEEIARMELMRSAAAARLNTRLGRAAATPVGVVMLPDVPLTAPPGADTLIAQAWGGRPGLRAHEEHVNASRADLAAARRELLPELQLGVAWQGRPAFPDMLSLMVGVSVPLFAGARQLPMRREMVAMRDMAAAELDAARSETASRVVEMWARVVQDQQLVHLYRNSILPQSRAAVQSALAGYRVGRVTFMQLVDHQMTVNRYEGELWRLTADFHQAMSELDALLGRSPGGSL